MNHEYLPIDFVNENDEVIGSGSIDDAWQTGAIHRIVVVFVRRPSDKALLLQKRSHLMEVAPSKWDFAAAGHVDGGETYQEASIRELKEEIGISGEPTLLGKYYHDHTTSDGKRLNRFYSVYLMESNDFPTHIQADEVDGVAWFTRQELAALRLSQKDLFTDTLFQAMDRFTDI